MKKFVTLVCVLCLLGLCACDRATPSTSGGQSSSSVSQAASEPDRTATGNKIGDDWYFFYTRQTNKKGDYDISEFKPSVYDAPSGKWYPSDQKPRQFRQFTDADGITTLTPSSDASAILAYKASADGNYRLDISYNVIADKEKVSDGVTVSVYAQDEKLYSRNLGASNEVFTEKITVNAMLKKGQYCTVIVDPNEHAYGDLCDSITAQVSQTLTAYVDNEDIWCFGPNYINGDGATQGENGWYLLAAEDGKASVSDLKECVFVPSGSTDSKQKGGIWVPADLADGGTDDALQGYMFTSSGVIKPCINGEFRSVGVAFKATKDGKHTVDLRTEGYNLMGSEPRDMKLTVYAGENKIKEVACTEIMTGAITFEAELKQGQYLYFVFNAEDKDSMISDFSVLVKKS